MKEKETKLALPNNKHQPKIPLFKREISVERFKREREREREIEKKNNVNLTTIAGEREKETRHTYKHVVHQQVTTATEKTKIQIDGKKERTGRNEKQATLY